MKFAIIESPLGTKPDGSRCSPEEFAKNQEYVNACMLDSFRRGEYPFASHGIYPHCLKDALPEERKLGMEAGFAVAKALYNACQLDPYTLTKMADCCIAVVYTDRGITSGMKQGIEKHTDLGMKLEFRELGGTWSE